MKEFLRENGIGVLILVVLVPFAGYVSLDTWSNSATIARIDERTAGQTKRIDGISGRLSDLGIRIKYEAIYSKFAAAVFATKAYEIKSKWHTNVYLIDPTAGLMSIYRASLIGRNDQQFKWALAGSVYAGDSSALPVETLDGFAIELQKEISTPTMVMKGAGFIAYRHAFRVKMNVDGLGYQRIAVKTIPVGLNWSSLVDEIKSGRVTLLEARSTK